MGDAPKVEFHLGSEVSVGQFFKSSFARAFVIHNRDSKSLDYQPLDNANCDETKLNGNNENNYFSLVNFGNGSTTPNSRVSCKGNTNVWKQIEVIKSPSDINELEKLQKQYQSLMDENRRLHDALTLNRTPHTQVIDNIVLQTEIETLQWQLVPII